VGRRTRVDSRQLLIRKEPNIQYPISRQFHIISKLSQKFKTLSFLSFIFFLSSFPPISKQANKLNKPRSQNYLKMDHSLRNHVVPLRYSRRVMWANPSGKVLRTPFTYSIASSPTCSSSSSTLFFKEPIWLIFEFETRPKLLRYTIPKLCYGVFSVCFGLVNKWKWNSREETRR
jgi:hypothetical protein